MEGHISLSSLFRRISQCSIGDGSTALFWDDSWSGSVLSQEYPRLLSYAKNARSLVRDVLNEEDFEDCFELPLSQAAF